MSLLSGLNDPQRTAVTTTDGPLLIIAGAGSGKTRVITHRIAYLIYEYSVPAENILAVTFTNKAAKEMKDRADTISGGRASEAWVSTFHALCARILREEIAHLGYDPVFSILDQGEQKALVRECTALLGGDPDESDVHRYRISGAKNGLLDPDAYSAQAKIASEVETAAVYRLYQEQLRALNALDFDDLLFLTVSLFDRHPDVLARYQDQFLYIMIDEYQDTNAVQYRLIRYLADHHRNLTAVGDDYQSIYGWRGSDISNILNFQTDYSNAKLVKLEQNYRSTRIIVDAANQVISGNSEQIRKRLWTANGDGEPIRVCQVPDGRQEAQLVAEEIQFLARNRPFSDFAVLFRTNSMTRLFEEEMVRFDIPYRVVGGPTFYDRREIKDIIAYLRLVFYPYDSLSLQRVINTPARGAGDKTLALFAQCAHEKGIPMWEALKIPAAASVTGRPAQMVPDFVEKIETLHEEQDRYWVSDLIKIILKDFRYQDLYQTNRERDRERLDNLREFTRMARGFDKKRRVRNRLEAFLDYISLLTDIERADDGGQLVTLLTVHASKGLEFPVVFMVGMEEGVFPHHRSLEDPTGIDEERRLCYVGMTRAQELLYMTHAAERKQYGLPQSNDPSRFLSEIPDSSIKTLALF